MTQVSSSKKTTDAITRPFHDDARNTLREITANYSRQLASIAEQLTILDNSSEIQPGHVEKAKKALEQQFLERSAIRKAVKTLAQIVGSALFGVAATGIALNMAQTFADGIGYIVTGAGGIFLVALGVMIRD